MRALEKGRHCPQSPCYISSRKSQKHDTCVEVGGSAEEFKRTFRTSCSRVQSLAALVPKLRQIQSTYKMRRNETISSAILPRFELRSAVRGQKSKFTGVVHSFLALGARTEEGPPSGPSHTGTDRRGSVLSPHGHTGAHRRGTAKTDLSSEKVRHEGLVKQD